MLYVAYQKLAKKFIYTGINKRTTKFIMNDLADFGTSRETDQW
jgi:hypothetical protein